jgi:hypothetical protein
MHRFYRRYSLSSRHEIQRVKPSDGLHRVPKGNGHRIQGRDPVKLVEVEYIVMRNTEILAGAPVFLSVVSCGYRQAEVVLGMGEADIIRACAVDIP